MITPQQLHFLLKPNATILYRVMGPFKVYYKYIGSADNPHYVLIQSTNRKGEPKSNLPYQINKEYDLYPNYSIINEVPKPNNS